jgi:hypothetical protein
MLRAIERGLCLNDFENMTPGMIIGYIVTYNNEHLDDDEKEDDIRMATQSDFDRF